MQDVIFETLTKILRLDSVACQTAALHGFSHLQHPSTEQVIGAYVQGKPEIDPELKAYALAAARFSVR
jgi:hypothetical protein